MKKQEFDLETPYQVVPVQLSNGRSVHRIGVRSSGDGAAQVTLDPNICSLDPFGDTAGCTRIAVFTYEAGLTLLEERDGKRLFALQPASKEEPALRLVLLPDQPGHRVSARLLVLGEKDQAITAVVTLERRA